ncbi:hypothetical protein CH330_07140 [candidate division WOR-3 bacterium JGI_Cruoil_03_51_56]|uniref:NfeD-like C-terminal domain-containing protein n=1 Tax=candidate division WOR-3 bacterium JGI_Cruoil_03_51_56 TaxID=1973747 RepID=A0A235BRR0_UNCW3|nr:MAG: hypothetical protein CH330_07140 [candidate division WOR-3 bacterium JGI_Cruoil_03_51_56]
MRFWSTPAFWIIIGLILAALEMVFPGLVIIWFGIAGVLTGILAIFVHNSLVLFVVFAGLSGVMVLCSRLIFRKITKPEPEPVGANRLKGVTGLVVRDINPPEYGRVKIMGEEWRAEAKVSITRNEKVKVIEVEGTHLVVEPIEERKV